MEDLEPPDSINLLTMDLLEATDLYDSIITWAEGFKKRNPEIDKLNKPEYYGLCRELQCFHESATKYSELNPDDFLIQDRPEVCKKRDFSREILGNLRLHLNTLEAMTDQNTDNRETNLSFEPPDEFAFKLPTEYIPGSGDYEFPGAMPEC